MIFEHHSEPVIPFKKWIKRVACSLSVALVIVFAALTLGVMGYHYLGNLAWIDSLLEASMILGGMGAIAPMTTDAVKVFASIYALFSGLIMMSTTGVILAPWLHRMLHKLYKAN